MTQSRKIQAQRKGENCEHLVEDKGQFKCEHPDSQGEVFSDSKNCKDVALQDCPYLNPEGETLC